MELFKIAFIFMGFATYRDGKTAQARMECSDRKCRTKFFILFYCIAYYKVKKARFSLLSPISPSYRRWALPGTHIFHLPPRLHVTYVTWPYRPLHVTLIIFAKYKLLSSLLHSLWARVAQVQGSNRGGNEIFSTPPERPWDPLSLLHNGYRLDFPGV
jgi:hypothetical protein